MSGFPWRRPRLYLVAFHVTASTRGAAILIVGWVGSLLRLAISHRGVALRAAVEAWLG